jgi:hypothetical protein
LSDEQPTPSSQTYPDPCIVVGVGRYGLQVLERLAEDWNWLQASSPGPTIGNLRLLHVGKGKKSTQDSWRRLEAATIQIARFIGDGDRPSLALDFAILRCLGLVRYHDGLYEVAVPQDAGLVQKYEEGEEAGEGHDGRLFRRRYFRWLKLAEDPLSSAEVLANRTQDVPTFDLFVSPLLQRVREGHSPDTILTLISRCRSMQASKDPSPWHWTKELFGEETSEVCSAAPFGGRHIRFSAQDWQEKGWLRAADVENWNPPSNQPNDDGALVTAKPPLEGYASPPLEWWAEARGSAGSGEKELHLNVPRPFLPDTKGLMSPLNDDAPGGHPLLRVDWESAGWAQDSESAFLFEIVDVSPFRLGLFDHHCHYGRAEYPITEDSRKIQHLEARIKKFGDELKRGLVRLWLDMQWRYSPSSGADAGGTLEREGAAACVRQSLEFLGQLVVRDLVADLDSGIDLPTSRTQTKADKFLEGAPLTESPSEFIREQVIARESPDDSAERALERRLSALGLGSVEASEDFDHRLFHQVLFEAGDLPNDPWSGGAGRELDSARGPTGGLRHLRQCVNREVRHLFNMDHLIRCRQRAIRRAPRLTVFMIADMGEPFSRAALRVATREVHAELQRSFGPIFETFREGFDRALNIVPILSMPHPADALHAGSPVESRVEEATIIESVHALRRWIEAIPLGTSCISQIFVNARVTDSAFVNVRDSVRQTVDFISLLVRNDISRDRWLRDVSTGGPGRDLFSSFTCYQIQFPAHRAREYMASRLALDSIHQLQESQRDGIDPDPVSVGELKDDDARLGSALAKSQKALDDLLAGEAETIANKVNAEASGVTLQTDGPALSERFDAARGEAMKADIRTVWQRLSSASGQMDGHVRNLRKDLAPAVVNARGQIAKHSDELIVKYAGEGGVRRSQVAIDNRRLEAKQELVAAEETRRRSATRCEHHAVPAMDAIDSPRESVVELAREKPSFVPMLRVGLAIWAVIGLSLGAPLVYQIYAAVGLEQAWPWLEWTLTALAPVIGAALFTLPVWWLLRRVMRRHVESIVDGITSLSDAARGIVEAGREGGTVKSGGAKSIWSFFASRLSLAGDLARRTFVQNLFVQYETDAKLADRIMRSLKAQYRLVQRRMEDLGVRSALGADAGVDHDDVTELFMRRNRVKTDSFIQPESLRRHYKERTRHAAKAQSVKHFVEVAGGLSAWRQRACFSDTETVLSHGREQFRDVTESALCDNAVHEAEALESLRSFVARYYANVGFGAKFIGYEGLDPDGISVPAHAALLAGTGFARRFEQMKRDDAANEGSDLTLSMDVLESKPLLPNTAFMLCLAQDVRARSFQNLSRFESALERADMAITQVFPLATELEPGASLPPVSSYGIPDSLRAPSFDGGSEEELSSDEEPTA